MARGTHQEADHLTFFFHMRKYHKKMDQEQLRYHDLKVTASHHSCMTEIILT